MSTPTRAARRPAQRGPARGGGSPAPAVAQQLVPRSFHHVRDGCAYLGLGLAGAGLVNVTGHPALDLPIAGAGALGGVATVVAGERARRRAELQDRVVEALAGLLGTRQLDRRTVALKAWSRGWPGQPGKVVMRYAPGAADSDPQWKPAIFEVLSARLLATYEVASHDQRKCVLVLRLVPERDDEQEELPAARVRAERAITELIGPSAKVEDVLFEGVEIKAIEVSHQAAAKLAASGYRTRVERVVSTMMPGRWRAVWDLENDKVRFEVRPALPTSVWLPTAVPTDIDDLLKNYRSVAIPCAVDEDGKEVVWHPARVPHVMLIGGTGSGKTSEAHALLGKITQYGWPVWVLDAKRVEFLGFRDWPNVQIIAGSVAQQVALVQRAWALMEHRYQLIESGQSTVEDFEPLVVFLDEFAEFRSNLMEWYSQIKQRGDPSRPPTLAQVASLARKARTARIHLVLSTQRPDAEFLGGEMRDNFGQRISMGRLSPQGAMMMWENPAVGVSLPRSCTGRAMATHGDGRPVEVQCYRFPDVHAPEGTPEWELLEAIRPATARHPRLVIVPPEPVVDLDTGETTEPTFRALADAEWAKAADRPDLDPAAHTGRTDAAHRREVSSALASLGLGEDRPHSKRPTETAQHPPLRLVGAPEQTPPGDEVGSDQTDDGDGDEYAGYDPAVPCLPSALVPGDLIEAEEGSGVWVVVDEPPEDDVASPGMVAISWRGDGDEAGFLSLDDVEIPVRHPQEEQP